MPLPRTSSTHILETQIKQASRPEKASYETILKDLDQKEVILAIARYFSLTPNDNEFLSYLARKSQKTNPSLTPQFESLRSSLRSASNQKILTELVRNVYGPDLSKDLEMFIKNHEQDLIRDLNIELISKTAKQLESAIDPTAEEGEATKQALWNKIERRGLKSVKSLSIGH